MRNRIIFLSCSKVNTNICRGKEWLFPICDSTPLCSSLLLDGLRVLSCDRVNIIATKIDTLSYWNTTAQHSSLLRRRMIIHCCDTIPFNRRERKFYAATNNHYSLLAAMYDSSLYNHRDVHVYSTFISGSTNKLRTTRVDFLSNPVNYWGRIYFAQASGIYGQLCA